MAERSATIRLSVSDNFSANLDKYRNKVGDAANATKTLDDNTTRAGGAFGALGDKIGAAITVGAALRIAQFGLEMNELGIKVNAAEKAFGELAANGGASATDMLTLLREKTGGVVDDLTLMSGANKLMTTGLAEGAEEVSTLVDLGIRLSGAMGVDATQGLENFNSALLNMSFVRLDTLGISAQAVRARMAELLETGQAVGREEAFKMAVMEEGAKTLERLGDAAAVGETALARMETRLQNVMQQASSNVATGVEGLTGIAEIQLGLHPEQIRQQEEAAAKELAVLQGTVEGALNDITLKQLPADFVTEYVRTGLQLAAADPGLAGDVDALNDQIFRSLGDQGKVFESLAAFEGRESEFDALTTTLADFVVMYPPYLAALDEQARLEREATESHAAMIAGFGERAGISQPLSAGTMAAFNQRAFDQRQEELRNEGIRSQFLGSMGDLEGGARDEAFRFREDMGGELPDLMTQQQADRIADMAREAEAMAESMRELDSAMPELFTDAQIAGAKDAAQSLDQMATDAQRAADALAGMSLEDFLGQGSGGAAGEISDLLLARMEESGATPDEISRFQETFDLATGRETAASQVFQNEVLPLLQQIAEEQGPEAAASAMMNVLNTMQSGALQGMSPDQMAMLLGGVATGQGPQPVGLGGVPPAFQGGPMIPGLTPGMPGAPQMPGAPMPGGEQQQGQEAVAQAAVSQMTIDTQAMAGYADTISLAFADIAVHASEAKESTPQLATDIGAMADSGTLLKNEIALAKSNIENMTSKVHVLKFRIEASDPQGVLGLIQGGAFGVKDNGGKVPGADGRAGGPQP